MADHERRLRHALDTSRASGHGPGNGLAQDEERGWGHSAHAGGTSIGTRSRARKRGTPPSLMLTRNHARKTCAAHRTSCAPYNHKAYRHLHIEAPSTDLSASLSESAPRPR